SRILLFFYCIVLPCLYLKYFSFLSVKRPPSSTIFPYTTLFRSTQRWMGTNDTSFPGGESSGTDDMVKLEELEFDGGNDKGNGHLTERTVLVDDDSGNDRVTSYAYDLKGNLLLETNPTAPHAFHKYDNMSRRIATGLYSG